MKESGQLSIAILGTRGIPARYGGFETLAEELSVRLTELGHRVTVYARHPLGDRSPGTITYRGVRVISLPAVRHKYLETPLHALVCFLDLFRRRFDVALLCNAANAPFSFLVRLRGIPLAVNVDGIERRRSKWNWLGRLWYRLGEVTSVLFASRIVADARVIADYYRENYRVDSEVIAYGADVRMIPPGKVLARFGLKPAGYILYVSRLEPENNALGVIEAYNLSGCEKPLVIVGDAPYAGEYKEKLRSVAGGGVIFAGFQWEDDYRELRSNCLIYVQATEVGGTHPALVEAMAYGNCIVANDTPEHREVLGDAGLYYPRNSFADLGKLMASLNCDTARTSELGRLAAARAAKHYTWQKITASYEALLMRLAGR